ncbi:zinc finger protein 493 isoform X2 [Esox lucius]|uniref:zinc finger protein 493 isoform X2 n=1 Tax=Esox lucius TaxID=8010 RepID=UPI001476CE07|nr:zinc finger protein 493 isoform X2 [Esox lucius]
MVDRVPKIHVDAIDSSIGDMLPSKHAIQDTLSPSDGILSALCVHPVERLVTTTEQAESQLSLNVYMETFTKELEVEATETAESTTKTAHRKTVNEMSTEERMECEKNEKPVSVSHTDVVNADPEPKDLEPECETVIKPEPKDLDPEWETVINPGPKDLEPECETAINPESGDLEPECETALNPKSGDLEPECETAINPESGDLEPECETAINPESGDLETECETAINPESGDLEPECETAINPESGDLEPECETVIDFQQEVLEPECSMIPPMTVNLEPECETVMVIGEDGKMEPLPRKRLQWHEKDGQDVSNVPYVKRIRRKSPDQMKSIDLSDVIISSMLHKPSVALQRLDASTLPLPVRPVRRNRGQKMKTFLARERKQTNIEFSEERRSGCKRVKTSNHNMCTVCGRVLSRFSDMTKHMQTHKNGHSHQCCNCQKTFKHLYTLQTHRKTCLFGPLRAEEATLSVACGTPSPTCEEEIAQSSIDRRTCKVCGKIVHRIGYLSTHMKIHSENRHHLPGGGQVVQNPGGEGTELSSCAPLEDSDSSSTSTTQDPSYHPEPSQTKTPKCSSTTKRPYRKSFLRQKHMCRICGKYVSAGVFEYHMRIHSDERPFACPHPQCGMKFIHSGGLRAHLRSFCKVRTVDAVELDSFNIRFECDKCDKTFTIQSKLRKHKLTHGPLYCSGCKKVLPNLETLNRHKLWHRQVKCTMCEETFMFTNLKTHYLDVHQFSGPYVCTHCPKTYKKFYSLIKHEMVHTGTSPLQCSHCPKRFIYNYDLVEHEKRHSGDRPCLCWECGKAFFTNLDLQNHMKSSHGEKPTEYRYPCRHCGKPFRLSNSRANHEKTKHGGVRHACTYCGKEYVCADGLKRHNLIHTGERPFKCNYDSCEKGFRSKAELTIHMRYHTGERPFKCNVCGKGFVQANFLTTHYRTHTGEKPYSCLLCDKSFNNHNGLKRHMFTHSDEKPHKCLDCGKAFQRKTLLNVHQRSCTPKDGK